MKNIPITISIDRANDEIRSTYGPYAYLEQYQQGKKIRYRFVNVPPIRNYPYGFKSVYSAMVGLELHTNGYIGWCKQQKQKNRQVRSATVSDEQQLYKRRTEIVSGPLSITQKSRIIEP